MIEITRKNIERAMLVAIDTKEFSKEVVEEHLNELEELANTAGAETIFKIVQSKARIDAAFYIGKGKAEELSQLVELNDIDIVIFDDDLSPVQARNLENLFKRKVIDRSGLILDIFATRAKTKEAKTQVELAQLQYMLPRLTRAWTHLSKQYGGIGTKGPGETQIETDRRIIRTRIAHLKEKLSQIESQRSTQNAARKNTTRIALAGYTNAGKSTLFNLLTSADVFAEDKLFATLDSTTRSLEVHDTEKIIITDTVGFIRKLPPQLVASFKSTLSEVREADIIFHIIDASHPFYEDQLKVVDETLKEFGSKDKQVIKIFNKIDLISDKTKIDFIRNSHKDCLMISAKRGINISLLKTKLNEIVENSFVSEKVVLGLTESKKVSQIHSLAEVLETKYDEDGIKIHYKTSKQNADKLKKIIYGT
ncbi:MAG: GTPase HflX [Ignavibacteriota bacterium]|nr:GTPase HflX [Ignavibacteriota bacterium]MCO6447734.1 GTPase HflX [Ignavibacterium album]MCZ2269084.1 GTPase HflX [Ignavibacteriales bacterium]QKK00039.1 MAG: GTPase HflX [Ignavibacteriota bacterium]HOJ07995.1 GTPase HflX [Ignavibacteriaceae bacterium]